MGVGVGGATSIKFKFKPWTSHSLVDIPALIFGLPTLLWTFLR